MITQHPYERLLLSLCIISVKKLRRKEFNLLRFTLPRNIKTSIEPNSLTLRPIPFCLSQFLAKTAPLPDAFSWISHCGSCLICQVLSPLLH